MSVVGNILVRKLVLINQNEEKNKSYILELNIYYNVYQTGVSIGPIKTLTTLVVCFIGFKIETLFKGNNVNESN